MNRVLVIGKNSFIGSNLTKTLNVKSVSHSDIDLINFRDYEIIINCSISPEYKNKTYDVKFDVDYEISQKIQQKSHYIMISTRRVYGTSTELKIYTEKSPINPFDYYSENKVVTEEKIKSTLENFTILRGSNFFGDEYGRQSFMGFCLTQLKNNDKIELTISGKVCRDFLHIEDVVKAIKKVCDIRKTGVFNLSSGRGLSVSKFVECLIAGKGSGLYSDSELIADQFILDNTLFCSEFNFELQKNYISKIMEIGKKYE